jgi:uncharacterized protein (TIGR03118 family)
MMFLHTLGGRRGAVELVSGFATIGVVFAGAAIAMHDDEHGPDRYTRTDLVTDDQMAHPAAHTDANLVNAWGIVPNPTGVWWVGDNGTGVSTLYDAAGNPQSLVVTVPAPAGATEPAKVTGVVFSGSNDFMVSDGMNHSGPARFIFASEDGLISGWAPGVPPPAPATVAHIGVDSTASGAIYKGLAIGHASNQSVRLYATDFHNAKVDVFDGMFMPVHVTGAFEDSHIPAGYAPFGIQAINGRIFVTYAKQGPGAVDDVKGAGFGFVDVYDGDGTLVKRFAEHGKLNAPWGIALAPSDFGRYSNHILIGNFGDGRINAFDMNGSFDDTLRGDHHRPIEIDGLWGLSFGNGAAAGPTNALFFTSGPDDESHGLFGRIDADTAGGPGGHRDGDDE